MFCGTSAKSGSAVLITQRGFQNRYKSLKQQPKADKVDFGKFPNFFLFARSRRYYELKKINSFFQIMVQVREEFHSFLSIPFRLCLFSDDSVHLCTCFQILKTVSLNILLFNKSSEPVLFGNNNLML